MTHRIFSKIYNIIEPNESFKYRNIEISLIFYLTRMYYTCAMRIIVWAVNVNSLQLGSNTIIQNRNQ